MNVIMLCLPRPHLHLLKSKLVTPANNSPPLPPSGPSALPQVFGRKANCPAELSVRQKMDLKGFRFSHRSDLKRYGIWKLTGPFSPSQFYVRFEMPSLIAMSSSCHLTTDRYLKRNPQRWDSAMPKGGSLSVEFSFISVPFFSPMCQRKVFIFNSKLYRHNRYHYQIFCSHHKVMKDVNTNWRDSFKHQTVSSWM